MQPVLNQSDAGDFIFIDFKQNLKPFVLRFNQMMRVYYAGMSYRLLAMLCVQLRLWREIW